MEISRYPYLGLPWTHSRNRNTLRHICATLQVSLLSPQPRIYDTFKQKKNKERHLMFSAVTKFGCCGQRKCECTQKLYYEAIQTTTLDIKFSNWRCRTISWTRQLCIIHWRESRPISRPKLLNKFHISCTANEPPLQDLPWTIHLKHWQVGSLALTDQTYFMMFVIQVANQILHGRRQRVIGIVNVFIKVSLQTASQA